MKKGIVGFAVLIGLIAIGAIALNSQGVTTVFSQAGFSSTTEATATVIPVVKDSGDVVVEGRLVPAQSVNLSFNTSGLVDEVFMNEGQAVKEGDLIARLRNQEQNNVSITSAQVEIVNAQKVLDDLYQNASVALAQLSYDIALAQKTVNQDQKKRTALDYPRASDKMIDEAQDKYDQAEKQMMEAQDYYDGLTGWDKINFLDTLQAARYKRDIALGTLNYIKGHPTTQEFNEADSRLALDRAKLEELMRKYAIQKDGPDPEAVKIAQASLDNAKAKLDAARASLDELELRAPFTGTVISQDLKMGQYVTPGAIVVILADFSRWRVETTNLTELNVLHIQPGNPSEVRFDAIPGTLYQGKLATIKNLGENHQGDITYTGSIDLDRCDPQLRWNMTASVVIHGG